MVDSIRDKTVGDGWSPKGKPTIPNKNPQVNLTFPKRSVTVRFTDRKKHGINDE